MKHLLIIIILFTVKTLAWAQYNDDKKLNHDCILDKDLTVRTLTVFSTLKDDTYITYSYDAKERRTEILYELWKKGELSKSQRNYFEYNKNGLIKSDVWENRLDNNWEISTVTSYVYEVNSNMTEMEIERMDGDSLVNYRRNLNTYYENNLKKSQIRQIWEEGAWVYTTKQIFEYYENGKLKTETLQEWQDKWVNNSVYYYEYFSDGNLKSLHLEIWHNDKWQVYSRNTVKIDEESNTRINTLALFKDDEWQDLSREVRTFREDGKIIAFIYLRFLEGEWVNQNKNIYGYIAEKPSETTFFKWQSGEWTKMRRVIYEHDNDGILQNIYNKKWDEGEWLDANAYLEFSDKNDTNYLFTAYRVEINQEFSDVKESKTEMQSFLQIYPNPFSSSVTVRCNIERTGTLELSLIGLDGVLINCIFDGKIDASGIYEKNYSFDNIPPGIYFLRLKSEDAYTSKKIIKVE